jgi:hypothetical protein
LFAAAVAIGLLALAIDIAGVATWQLWVAFVLPDVALLAGAARGLERGQLSPRAVPLYNALHHPAGPLVAIVIAAAVLPDAWLAAALAWGAHVAMDRAAGYGLRTREGFQRWPAAA